MPSLASSVRSASTYSLDDAAIGVVHPVISPIDQSRALLGVARSLRPANFATAQQMAEMTTGAEPPKQEKIDMANIRRLVQVYIRGGVWRV